MLNYFFRTFFFSIQYGIWAKIYPALSKFSTKLSITHFTCPREHFYKNIMLTLWNNFRLWARKCRICGGTFAALLIKVLFCLQMGISKNSFEGNSTFSDFFGRPGNIFWYFPCIIRGMVVQTEFHKPRWTYPIRKILWENFLSFPDYERIFANSHWSLLGMLSKLVYFFRGALWERLSFFLRVFQTPFRTLSDNRPDLWRNFSTALPKLHSACPKNFSIFFAVVCHVLFNFGFERKKS